MGCFGEGKNNQRINRFMRIVFCTVLSVFLSFLFLPGNYGQVLAAELTAEPFEIYIEQAVRNNYNLYLEDTEVDGEWGNFGAVDAYALTSVGVNLEQWSREGIYFKEEILDLIDRTIENESMDNRRPAQRVANEYVIAKEWGELEKATQLLTILKNRQSQQENGSFDNNAFSDIPSFAVLGQAGVLKEFCLDEAVNYILSKQDVSTGAWTDVWQDFQTTAQAVRALTYFLPLIEEGELVQQAIEKGLSWLQERQQADGSFIDADGFDDSLINTVEVLLTLEVVGKEFTDVDWLSSENKGVVDYLREKALNEDGSFGSFGNLADNTWVVKALQIMGIKIDKEMALALRISPDNISISTDKTIQLQAEAFSSNDGWEDVTSLVSWWSQDGNIATVDQEGLVTALQQGCTVITAEHLGLQSKVDLCVTESNGGGGNSRPPESKIRVSVRVSGENGERLFNGRVTLDKKKVTVFDALVATGLSYAGDSNFISAIEGQRNRGLNGWMVKVNEELIASSIGSYTLKKDDAVQWFYSSDSDNSVEGIGGNKKSPATDPENPKLEEEREEGIVDLETYQRLFAKAEELHANFQKKATQLLREAVAYLVWLGNCLDEVEGL